MRVTILVSKFSYPKRTQEEIFGKRLLPGQRKRKCHTVLEHFTMCQEAQRHQKTNVHKSQFEGASKGQNLKYLEQPKEKIDHGYLIHKKQLGQYKV